MLGQIKTDNLHGLPKSVTTFQGAGQVTKIAGGDGVVRDMLKIPGEYRGKQEKEGRFILSLNKKKRKKRTDLFDFQQIFLLKTNLPHFSWANTSP